LFGTGGRDPSEWVVAIVGMPNPGESDINIQKFDADIAFAE
jgi:hypothetical protein